MIKKILLTFLLAFICFFGIDKLFALETTISPSASCYWTHAGDISCPQLQVMGIDNDTYNGYQTMDSKTAKVTFDYPLGWVGETNKYYDVDFQFYTSNGNYNDLTASFGNKACNVSVPHHITATISNGNGFLKTGDAYHYLISCKDILVPSGMSDPVTLAIFFPNVPSDIYFGYDTVAIRYGISIVPSNKQLLFDNNSSDKLGSIDNHLSEVESSVKDTNKTLKETNETLNDDDTSESSSEAQEFFEGFTTDTFGLTSVITAPLTLIGNLATTSCSAVPLSVPYVGGTLSLPCMTPIYERHFKGFFDIYQSITFGIIAYWVCVRVFALVKDFKNPDHDEIEVMDL